ncbi:sugar transferase [Neobacillus sp. FSL H8-0543]|uniref:sugar transferase n=1 Tax=Neobacillus sp. FSL H8-0543 TaxID=2954672 RepID=UPI0031597BA3
MKRLFDLLLSSLILIIFLPIISAAALLIRIKIGSPIIFKQQRPGLNGKPFVLYKFRTMTNERNKIGELLRDDLRLTPFGKLLRKLSIDEFPQLLNVIKGDMSLIGPRPLLTEYLLLYTEEQSKRHLVRPGITGWAQINGRNAIAWEEKFKLDVWYVKNRSFILDMKILLLTIKKVITSEGISNQNHVTMPDFEGDATRKHQNYNSL